MTMSVAHYLWTESIIQPRPDWPLLEAQALCPSTDAKISFVDIESLCALRQGLYPSRMVLKGYMMIVKVTLSQSQSKKSKPIHSVIPLRAKESFKTRFTIKVVSYAQDPSWFAIDLSMERQ